MFGRDTRRSFLGGDKHSALGGDGGSLGAQFVRERKGKRKGKRNGKRKGKRNEARQGRLPLDSGPC